MFAKDKIAFALRIIEDAILLRTITLPKKCYMKKALATTLMAPLDFIPSLNGKPNGFFSFAILKSFPRQRSCWNEDYKP